jgi:glycosyltransferase involved in cell wall biosynthesis
MTYASNLIVPDKSGIEAESKLGEINGKKPNKRIGILYLGSNGAGVNFAKLLSKEFPSYGREVVLFKRTNLLFDHPLLEMVNIDLPKRKFFAFLGAGQRKAFNKIKFECQTRNIKTIIIPMAHPWDLRFQSKLRSCGIRMIRVIHDPSRHPGDIWPTDSAIKSMCEVEALVTLSQYTASKLETDTSKVTVSCHPELQYSKGNRPNNHSSAQSNYDLIIGRQKKYQNTVQVVKWWARLPKELTNNRTLIVAGKLGLVPKFLLRKEKNVVFKNQWLSDEEFEKLILNSSRVLCLYTEASQSGIVAATQSLKIPVLVSDVGGLPEQIHRFGGGVIVPIRRQSEWQEMYSQLNEIAPASFKGESPTDIFMRDILKAIEQAETSKC